MPSLWIDLARNIRRAVPLLFVYSTAHSLILLFTDGGSGTQLIMLVFLGYSLFRAALFETSPLSISARSGESALPPEAIGKFLLVALLFGALTLGPSIIVAIMATGNEERELSHVLLWTFAIFLPLSWVLLSTFGTLLPAAAAGEPFSPLTALQAASKTWPHVALQLLLLPGLCGSALALSHLWALVTLESWSLPHPIYFGADVVIGAIASVTHVVTVVILTRAYRSAWPGAAPVDQIFA